MIAVHWTSNQNQWTATNPFYHTGGGNDTITGTGRNEDRVGFDVKRYHSTYQDSGIVQPLSLTFNYIVKI